MRTAFAIARRDSARWFASPVGYIFITVFVLLASALQVRDRFFDNNLANLAPLNEWFPYLLVFFIPAVAMAMWADERRHGTDELLLTLPATDFELVVGKYLAGLGIYAGALAFSFVNVVMLSWLGRPDFGLVLSTYAGYLLLGAALLAVAMAGSFLTESVAVAFVLGALFCLVLVVMGDAAGLARDVVEPADKFQKVLRISSAVVLVLGVLAHIGLGWMLQKRQDPALIIAAVAVGLIELLAAACLLYEFRPFEELSKAGVRRSFNDFASGTFSIAGVVYFLGIAAIGMTVSWSLLRRRRMTSGGWQLAVRVLSLIASVAAITVIMTRADARIDMTAERLFSLSDSTHDVIKAVTKERPVFIQAFVSPDVPKDYVQQRETLLSLLQQYDRLGGERVIVRVRETKRASDAAREARDKYGVKPHEPRDMSRRPGQEVYLGVVVTCGTEETVIPFLFKGLSVEYELTQALRTVLKKERLKVGIVATDARWMGGTGFSMAPSWQVVSELQRRYDVISIPAPESGPITEKVDVLVVPMPSSLAPPAMDNLLAFIRQGKPTLLLDDPYPGFNSSAGPNEPKVTQTPMGPMPAGERGNARAFYEALGVRWNTREIVWDTFNPHVSLRALEREIVFVGKDNGSVDAINLKDPITSGLQELVVLRAGRIRTAGVPGLEFTPLFKAGAEYGISQYSDVRERQSKYEPLPFPNKHDYALAARIKGRVAASKAGEPDSELNVVMVADVDLISDQFFDIQREAYEHLNFDNTTFVLNCVDSLAGDDSVVALRKRRPRHRTLERFESESRVHDRKMLEDVQAAEGEATKAREAAKAALKEKVEAVRALKIDDLTKEIMLENVEDVESRRLAVAEANIEDEKARKIERSQNARDQAIEDIQFRHRAKAIVFPFVPPFSLWLVMFVARILRELREARK